jgi:hypothetical protein
MVPKIWELYPDLAKTVKKAHEDVGLNGGGHDFDHALRVAQMALLLAWETGFQPYAFKAAGVAGLLHNNDRILERKLQLKSHNVSDVDDEAVRSMTEEMLLENTDLREYQRRLIIEAVINHGSKPNQPNDHLITVALTDADRLINMEPDVIIRSGQHHADIPALDPVYMEATPGANYRDPKTVLWDIANCISWANECGPYVLRLPKARELGRQRADYLIGFIETLKRQRYDLGLFPYPEI